MMLKAVAAVSAELCKSCQPHQQTIEMIVATFKAKTGLDEIEFIEFDTPIENPIWGEFARWKRRPALYVDLITVVEIRYAKHLLGRADWLRFVVTKELCHALEAPEGKHEVADRTFDDLANKFSLYSHRREVGPVAPAYELEIMAEIAAVELLCPINIREAYIADHGKPDEAACRALATYHNLPLTVIEGTFDPNYNASIRDLLNGA